MPILKKRAADEDLTMIFMGTGDVQTTHALCQDPITHLPDMPRSFIGFVEMEPPEGMMGGEVYSVSKDDFPKPDVTLHFGSLEILDHYIKTVQAFRKSYVESVTAITRKAAQA